MRPLWGELKITGADCRAAPRMENGGVNSAAIHAASFSGIVRIIGRQAPLAATLLNVSETRPARNIRCAGTMFLMEFARMSPAARRKIGTWTGFVSMGHDCAPTNRKKSSLVPALRACDRLRAMLQRRILFALAKCKGGASGVNGAVQPEPPPPVACQRWVKPPSCDEICP